MQAQQEQAPEQRTDRRGIQWKKRQKFAVARESAIGDKPVTVVAVDVTVEAGLKQLIEGRAFGMPRAVLRQGFRNHPDRSVLLPETLGFGPPRAICDRLRPEGEHGGQ